MPNSGRPDARLRLISVLLFMLLMTSCVPLPPAPVAGNDSRSTPSRGLVIYAPATPSSIPILLAARHIEGAQVTIFNNHTQANAQFLRGDIDILVTGLSVGLDLFKNGAPVQVIDSYVAGVTYLVTYGKKVKRFADLKGETIYIPFEGSPIEETTRFFIEREGLIWKKDILVAYAPCLVELSPAVGRGERVKQRVSAGDSFRESDVGSRASRCYPAFQRRSGGCSGNHPERPSQSSGGNP